MLERLTVLLFASIIACLGGCSTSGGAPEAAPESVVLLHGMGRTTGSMAVLAWRFEQEGYRTYNFPYNQRTASLDDLSDGLHRFIEERVETAVYHLIGHSLGNIIIRNGFKKTYPEGLERIVMIAPPNRPAELAQRFGDNPVYQWVTGDSGQKLADTSFYEELPVPKVEFGVIAGSITYGIGFDGPNDGVIKVENTKLPGMADWVVLEHTHTFIMSAQDTFDQARHFLETGAFEPAER